MLIHYNDLIPLVADDVPEIFLNRVAEKIRYYVVELESGALFRDSMEMTTLRCAADILTSRDARQLVSKALAAKAENSEQSPDRALQNFLIFYTSTYSIGNLGSLKRNLKDPLRTFLFSPETREYLRQAEAAHNRTAEIFQKARQLCELG